jgi:galactokinase
MFTEFLPQAQIIIRAPGRVNLLGEHVDYNDGCVLPAAIDRAVRLAAFSRSDSRVILHAADLNRTVAFDLERLDTKTDIEGHPLPSWALYPAGVAQALQQRGLPTCGLEAAYTSDVPVGAGLSSSAAVEIAFAALWEALGGWQVDRITLAKIGQEAENRYVGVNSGLMDQFASANGVEGHALFFDTRSLEWRPMPLPTRTVIVIADSRVRRSLTTSAYNDRRAACEQAVEWLRPHLPGIRALRDVSPAQFERYAPDLPEIPRLRAQHIVNEIARVEQAVICLQGGDAEGFGQLMLAGHASLRDLFQVSCPELDSLVEVARDLPGCFGARLSGAGFGGCTVNLVAEDLAEAFIEKLKTGYTRHTGRAADVYLCHASRSAHVEGK